MALLHPNFVDTGSERYIWSLAHRLLDYGVEVHVFAGRLGDRIDPRILCHRIPRPRLPRSLRPWFFEGWARRAVSSASFDLVHGFGKTVRQDVYTEGSGLAASFAAYQDSGYPPQFGRIRNLAPSRFVSRRLETRRYRHRGLRTVLFMSEALRREFTECYGLDGRHTAVVYSAVDCRRFAPPTAGRSGGVRQELGIAAGDLVLLMVGNDFRRKNVDTAVRAMVRLGDAGQRCRLLVVGRDRSLPFRALARRLGVEDRTWFVGARADVERYFQAADVLLHPARFDAFGIAVLEAMACALPVVVSRRAGSHELVNHGTEGLVLEETESVEELAAAVRLLADPEERSRMGEAARARALQFDWSLHIRQILEFYAEVAP